MNDSINNNSNSVSQNQQNSDGKKSNNGRPNRSNRNRYRNKKNTKNNDSLNNSQRELQNNSSSNYKNKRPNKNKRYSKSGQDNTSQNNEHKKDLAPGQSKAKRYNNNNKKKNYNSNKNYNKGPLTPRKIRLTYNKLLEDYFRTRKKYFDRFHLVDPRNLKKITDQFYDAVEKLRKFEDSMTEDWQIKAINKILHPYPLDLDFSKINQIEAVAEKVDPNTVFEDIHFENITKEDFKNDIEESVGTLEDYYNYKGKDFVPKNKERIN